MTGHVKEVFCLHECRKVHCPSFKLTESSTYKTNSWVVKFAPDKPDGWNNVSTIITLL